MNQNYTFYTDGIGEFKKYTINEVLEFSFVGLIEKEYDKNIVKMNSLRYKTFKESGTTCCNCNREGTHFRLQKDRGSNRYHFGLWSNDNIQMTKDHIIPKSLGGTNDIKNLQTMCMSCNENKSDAVTIEEINRGSSTIKVIPQNKNLYNVNLEKIREKIKTLHTNEFLNNKKIVDDYKLKHNKPVYVVELEELDEKTNNAKKYLLNYYKQIIHLYKGNISVNNKDLTGLTKKIAKDYILLEKEKQLIEN